VRARSSWQIGVPTAEPRSSIAAAGMVPSAAHVEWPITMPSDWGDVSRGTRSEPATMAIEVQPPASLACSASHSSGGPGGTLRRRRRESPGPHVGSSQALTKGRVARDTSRAGSQRPRSDITHRWLETGSRARTPWDHRAPVRARLLGGAPAQEQMVTAEAASSERRRILGLHSIANTG